MKAIEMEGVTVRYGEKTVLKDVTFQLDKGDFMGIIGPNGGGKTTLLRVILGLINPDEGEVRVFEKSPSIVKDILGYVPQTTNFDTEFPIDVWKVVLMGRLGKLRFKPFFSKEDKRISKRSLELVDMWRYKDKQFSKLSVGQQQRVLIARALSTQPKILLLDEPTASVDEQVRKSIYKLLSELNNNNEITIILVSHDIGVISSCVKKIACLNKYFIYHGSDKLTTEMLEKSYGCPVDLIAHGHPHRVFEYKMPKGD